METLYCTTLDSTIGPLFLAASGRGLVALEFDARLPGQQSIRPNPRHLREEKKSFSFEVSPRLMRPYVSELEEYFAASGASSLSRSTFAAPISRLPAGERCWRFPTERRAATLDIARAVGKPNAFRAVGMANNRNPDRDRRSLPSRDRLRWHALRLRRRPRREA